MGYDREALLKQREKMANSRGQRQERTRFPFGPCKTSEILPGEATFRPAKAHPLKNPRGIYLYQTITIPDIKGGGSRTLLHPESYADPNAAEVYHGILEFLDTLKATKDENDEPIMAALPVELVEIVKGRPNKWNKLDGGLEQFHPVYRIPGFISALEVTPPDWTDKNGVVQKGNPDFPKFQPVKGKPKLDVVLQFSANSAFADAFLDLVLADEDFFDPKNGSELIFNNTNPKQPTIRRGEKTALSAEQESYMDEKYPDLYAIARMGKQPRHETPSKIKDLVEGTWWFKYFEEMGFSLPEPVNPLANLKMKTKKKAEPVKVTVPDDFPGEDDPAFDDVPF